MRQHCDPRSFCWPRRARCGAAPAYQGTLFAVFNLFWTAIPLMLHVRFGLGQAGIAAFALAGAAGAFSAPLAGIVADRGGSRWGTGLALLGAAIALLVSGWGQEAGSILILVAAAIILDAATQANQVFGQRINPKHRPEGTGPS